MFGDYLTDYFRQGYCFFHTRPSSGPVKGTVFLIHGWGVRCSSMIPLANALVKNGYSTFIYDYPSSEKSIKDHAVVFLQEYRKILLSGQVEGGIHFLTHSMGGLILRSAMSCMTDVECHLIEDIVMLGPPNKGSRWARFGLLTFMRKRNPSLMDMILSPKSYVNNIPDPVYMPPVGIIAGRYDFKVALRNTSMPKSLPFKRVIVNCCHFGLRNPARTMRYILRFITNKTFNKEN